MSSTFVSFISPMQSIKYYLFIQFLKINCLLSLSVAIVGASAPCPTAALIPLFPYLPFYLCIYNSLSSLRIYCQFWVDIYFSFSIPLVCEAISGLLRDAGLVILPAILLSINSLAAYAFFGITLFELVLVHLYQIF